MKRKFYDKVNFIMAGKVGRKHINSIKLKIVFLYKMFGIQLIFHLRKHFSLRLIDFLASNLDKSMIGFCVVSEDYLDCRITFTQNCLACWWLPLINIIKLQYSVMTYSSFLFPTGYALNVL